MFTRRAGADRSRSQRHFESGRRLGPGKVSIHEAGRVLQQLLLPLAQADASLDQPANGADVIGEAEAGGADELVVLEFEAQIPEGGLILDFDMLSSLRSPPLAE